LLELNIRVPPGLVINGKIVSQKIVPAKSDIEQWIREALNNIDFEPT
jgi:hypothetical protein